MTHTVTNTASNQAVIYLPATTWGGTWTQPASWTTNTWTDSFHPEGMKIVEAINKAYTMMVKYEGLINGLIFKELNKRLSDLLFQASCQWGMGLQGGIWGAPNTWTTVPATTSTGLMWGTITAGTTSVSTSNVWYQLDNLFTNASTALNTTGITYIY